MFWRNYLFLCGSVGKSPNAVAAEVGIKSSGTVTGWSNGAIPRKGVLFKLCQYFGVTEEQFLSTDLLSDEAEKEKPAKPQAGLGELSEEERAYIKWFREEASEKEKALVRVIVKGEK